MLENRDGGVAKDIRGAVIAFQQGIAREQNFEILVRRFYRPVQHFLGRWTKSTEDRDDITQEVFLRAFKSLKEYRGDAQFSTWLFKIAHNTCMRRLDRDLATRKAASRLGDDDDPSEEEVAFRAAAFLGSQLDDLIAKERSALLRDATERLPTQMRRCVELRICQDLSYEQIAAVLQLSVGTVKAHLFHAREKLRDHLSGLVRRGDL